MTANSVRRPQPLDREQTTAIRAWARQIGWELLIAQQYDQMVKYATALRLGTAEAEQVLRRFTRGGPKHPTYPPSRNSAGPCAHLRLRLPRRPELRREIHDGLQVVENWNSAQHATCSTARTAT